MDALLQAPVLIKVLTALALILVLNRLFKNLIAAVLTTTVIFAFWCGHGPIAILTIGLDRFLSLGNAQLLLVIAMVIGLSSQMRAAGIMADLVQAVRSRVSPRASMAILPAVIGWLPMPGGALFSAPMVDECDVNRDIDPTLKVQANYWFRHVWEFWWPLYPGVLVALKITRIDAMTFTAILFPMSLAMIAIGYFTLLRKVHIPAHDQNRVGNMFTLISPILVVVATFVAVKLGYGFFSSRFPQLPELSKFVPVIVGILAAMLVLQKQRPLQKQDWKEIIWNKRILSLAAIVAAVRVFGAFVETKLPNGTALGEAMNQDLARWGIPPIAIIVIIPFVAGLSTGISVAYVGASLPIVMGILGQNPTQAQLLASVALAQTAGFAGMALSPVHVCLIVTNEHFKTRLLHSIRGLLVPAAALLIAGILLYAALSHGIPEHNQKQAIASRNP